MLAVYERMHACMKLTYRIPDTQLDEMLVDMKYVRTEVDSCSS